MAKFAQRERSLRELIGGAFQPNNTLISGADCSRFEPELVYACIFHMYNGRYPDISRSLGHEEGPPECYVCHRAQESSGDDTADLPRDERDPINALAKHARLARVAHELGAVTCAHASAVALWEATCAIVDELRLAALDPARYAKLVAVLGRLLSDDDLGPELRLRVDALLHAADMFPVAPETFAQARAAFGRQRNREALVIGSQTERNRGAESRSGGETPRPSLAEGAAYSPVYEWEVIDGDVVIDQANKSSTVLRNGAGKYEEE
ncbi:hypothetical protein F4780DRAFT_787646 [Xylariomycetidae sp. FL0641]|nr:hypothetical protein F4780DRAFT_787646 [Xylariomycetidae sp. FL0641]